MESEGNTKRCTKRSTNVWKIKSTYSQELKTKGASEVMHTKEAS
jgi:hypothetical protein